MTHLPDYASMSDPDLLAERASIRADLEQMPRESDARRVLVALYDAATRELDHRATRAWSA
jgi:hypothetical protein